MLKSGEILSCTSLSSSISPSFWSKYTEIKLNIDKLAEKPRNIWGYFFLSLKTGCAIPLLDVDSTSFNSDVDEQGLFIPFPGKLINKNTVEQFKEINKTELINEEGRAIVQAIKNGEVFSNPSLLNSFFILSFADLKKYHYYYWFAFPVPNTIALEMKLCVPVTQSLSPAQITDLYNKFHQLSNKQKAYFIVQLNESGVHLFNLSKVKELSAENYKQFHFGFYDISSKNKQPVAQLRNYIAFILHYCPFLCNQPVTFLALHLSRERSQVNCSNSVLYTFILPAEPINDSNSCWVGWEKNERNKMGPRMANMKASLDPTVLAENAIDLNLKLMKWRLLPDIDLEKIKNSKCLLLGSGTLGCSVARSLLAWGTRNITFVDNSTVSYSNPVRQSLFTYEDSVQMKPKSEAAAESLRRIFPSVNSAGFQINIPMPGHPVGESLLQSTLDSIKQLDELIKSHDIVFLLMDSRESRWLPTLLGAVHQKIVINAALGFDTYLVMRHGVPNNNLASSYREIPGFKTVSGSNLGCYFCNDVTAPGNSVKDRTLDQQCTVTRPGVAQIAGALAVELVISLLQHADGSNAPAFYKTSATAELDNDSENQCILGLIPHSIRGFLSNFSHVLPATEKYKNCIACSELVLSAYKEEANGFLLKVFNSSKHLEDVTGLSEIYNENLLDEVLEFGSDESDSS